MQSAPVGCGAAQRAARDVARRRHSPEAVAYHLLADAAARTAGEGSPSHPAAAAASYSSAIGDCACAAIAARCVCLFACTRPMFDVGAHVLQFRRTVSCRMLWRIGVGLSDLCENRSVLPTLRVTSIQDCNHLFCGRVRSVNVSVAVLPQNALARQRCRRRRGWVTPCAAA